MASLSLPTALAALTGTWVPSVRSVVTTVPYSAHVIEAVAKLEGRLNAYSINENPIVEEQVFLASNALSKSLVSFNSELKEFYPSLSKEGQEAVKDAYLALGFYLEKLAEEANQMFKDEDGKAKATFEVQKIGEIAPNLPDQFWVGSAVAV